MHTKQVQDDFILVLHLRWCNPTWLIPYFKPCKASSQWCSCYVNSLSLSNAELLEMKGRVWGNITDKIIPDILVWITLSDLSDRCDTPWMLAREHSYRMTCCFRWLSHQCSPCMHDYSAQCWTEARWNLPLQVSVSQDVLNVMEILIILILRVFLLRQTEIQSCT